MIRVIEAKNFRCLRSIRQPLGPFHVLVGPNASGKTTFLDVVNFLGRFVSEGLEAAVSERTNDFRDLLFGRTGKSFELAIEAAIPKERQFGEFDIIRYEVSIGADATTEPIGVRGETVWLKQSAAAEKIRPVLTLDAGRAVFFAAEDYAGSPHDSIEFRLSASKSALANLPEDETKYPASTWLKDLLRRGVRSFVVNSVAIRHPRPPHQGKGLRADGSNLPWAIWQLEQPENQERFRWWLEHLRAEFPDLERISTVERPEDRHRYLRLHYRGGLEVPSWMVSDGTLRLLALTIPAYLPDFTGICLVEEPENGIHPGAVEAVFKSLSSVYGAQVLLATHSPVIVSVAELKDLLCFRKDEQGATEIIAGPDHPALQDWRGQVNLGMLFAGGVLR